MKMMHGGWHAVPSYNNDRLLLKFAYGKKSYKEVLTMLINKGLVKFD